ncbi:MAG: type II toxin-antitoxin system PemK/MazF family toxin [Gemmatimonadales bacterium]
MKRYEIRRADRAPVVIVSIDTLNDVLSTVTVCPLTTQLHPAWRTRLGVKAGSRDAEIAVDQIRTISKSRISKKLGSLTPEEAATLRRIITEMYGE